MVIALHYSPALSFLCPVLLARTEERVEASFPRRRGSSVLETPDSRLKDAERL